MEGSSFCHRSGRFAKLLAKEFESVDMKSWKFDWDQEVVDADCCSTFMTGVRRSAGQLSIPIYICVYIYKGRQAKASRVKLSLLTHPESDISTHCKVAVAVAVASIVTQPFLVVQSSQGHP